MVQIGWWMTNNFEGHEHIPAEALTLYRAILHFTRKKLTLRHAKVFLAFYIATDQKQPLTAKAVAQTIGLKELDIRKHITELVAQRYLHEVIPTFGDATPCYKLGPLGGTFLRTVLNVRRN